MTVRTGDDIDHSLESNGSLSSSNGCTKFICSAAIADHAPRPYLPSYATIPLTHFC